MDRGSNDGTGDICQEYKALYPDKVRFYTRVPGDFPEKSRIIRLRGDLGIICRDEELWSDIFKLQRQGTFLMTHPEYDLCFHNVRGSNMQYMRSRDYSPGENSILNVFLINVKTFLATALFSVCTFTRYSFRGKIRCLGNIYSEMLDNTSRKANLPFLKNNFSW
ncbi:MAG: hypothetical protein BHV68_22495 [Bacteroidales bacterium 43_8]|nr:MAG: hypothetical protein BHV68_22495 [Bacteroidales bacterium 43_8]